MAIIFKDKTGESKIKHPIPLVVNERQTAIVCGPERIQVLPKGVYIIDPEDSMLVYPDKAAVQPTEHTEIQITTANGYRTSIIF
jgi:hypothetical protein